MAGSKLTPRQRRNRDRLVRNKRREANSWLRPGDDVNVVAIYRNGGFIGPVTAAEHRAEAMRERRRR